MCYRKPGPRCSTHARQTLEHTQKLYVESKIPQQQLTQAVKDYYTTPAGIKILTNELGENHPITRNAKKVRGQQLTQYVTVRNTLPTGVLEPATENRPELTYETYYEATNRKHFGDPNKPGSQFVEVKDLHDLVTKTLQYRGTLTGDDRGLLIQEGADPEAFSPGYFYLKTPIGGFLGSATSELFLPTQPVTVTEKIPGSNILTIVVEAPKPQVTYGTLILAPQSTMSPKNPGKNKLVVVTAHPGYPSPQSKIGQLLTRGEKQHFDASEHSLLKNHPLLTINDVLTIKQNVREQKLQLLYQTGRLPVEQYNKHIQRRIETINLNVTPPKIV